MSPGPYMLASLAAGVARHEGLGLKGPDGLTEAGRAAAAGP